MFRAGAIEVCITPPIGVELAGYYTATPRYATDIHDHLMAQALVLDDGATRVALVTSDLCSISVPLTQTVRAIVQAQAGIPPGNVMVTCAHTHTAPTTVRFRACGAPDAGYVRLVARYLAGAVVAAANRLTPARLSVGRGEHTYLAWNRLGWNEIDPSVEVARIDTADGEPLALVVHYACHPVMPGKITRITADFPGALRRCLHARYPGVILFANGACGDIDPVTNRDAWGSASFSDIACAGAELADDAWDAATAATPVEDVRLHVRHGTLRLRYDTPSPEALRAAIARYRAEVRAMGDRPESFGDPAREASLPRLWLRYYRALARRLQQGRLPDHEDAALQAFVIGDALAWLAIPAEAFTAEGRMIRAASSYAHTLPICYANGLYGYLPPRRQFEADGYAARLAAAVYDRPFFTPDVAERLVEAASALLR
ncbi:MAG: neutral/alkaline non-lysosomal ceramidase N-terminal domain-containing protein [Anaerolineae bacterium]|nr:neutral/alkaline non-lysosomal ceramidase N-terminal domain-containing protein [Anaerolineae bacterium]